MKKIIKIGDVVIYKDTQYTILGAYLPEGSKKFRQWEYHIGNKSGQDILWVKEDKLELLT